MPAGRRNVGGLTFLGRRPCGEQQARVDGLAGWREKHPEVSVRTLLEHDKPRHAPGQAEPGELFVVLNQANSS